MRPTSRGSSLGVSPFRIWHLNFLLNVYLLQGRPTIVNQLRLTAARLQVAVLTAQGTDAPAGLGADPLHRYGKQDVLSQDIIEQQPASLVKRDLRLPFVDLDFFRRMTCGSRRAIKQVKIRVDREHCFFQAAVAVAFDLYAELSPNANLAQGVTQQLYSAFRLNIPDLPQLPV